MAQFLDLTGLTRFKNKNDGIYAQKDGYYQNLGAGIADQLSSTVGIEDQTPYNFRTSGGSTEIGDREELNAVVGASVPWNQLVNKSLFPATKTENGITFTNNNDGSITVSGTASALAEYEIGNTSSQSTRIAVPKGHKVYLRGCPTGGSTSGYFMVDNNQSGNKYDVGTGNIYEVTSNYNYVSIRIRVASGTVISTPVKFYPQISDLTLALGSTIADYIYALEQSNAGSGVAYFRKLFPKLYYAYNSGALISARTNLHKMVEFNQWDEEWEVGSIDNDTGLPVTYDSTIRCKNFINCVPNTIYYAKTAGVAMVLFFYDANGNYLSRTSKTNNTFTTPVNACFIKFRMETDYGTTYNHDICINLHWDGERDGEYEPYTAHEYALDDIILRGMLWLDANNNLHADGDRYLPNGTVIRNRGRITFDGSSDESWDVNASGGHYRATIYLTGTIKAWNDGSKIGTLLSNMYPCGLWNSVFAGNPVIGQTGSAIGIGIDSLNITTVNAWKTWLASNNLVVEFDLATPTTEAASPYQHTQIVDDFGTEEFVDAAVEANERDVAIPVGNVTFYQNNLKAKLEMAPNSPDGDGVYVVQQTNGENEYIPLVIPVELPTFPSDDGTYVFKITVSGGTVTKAWVEEV